MPLLSLLSGWRGYLAGAALLVAIGAGGWIWMLRQQLAAAEARHAMAETARQEAERRAVANAQAVAQLTAEHARQMQALAQEAAASRAAAAQLAGDLEAVRRDPTHAVAAAPVLRGAVERLRERRAAPGTGSAPGAAAPAGAAAELRARAAPAIHCGPYPRPRGRAAARL